MPRFSIGFPCKELTTKTLRFYVSVVNAVAQEDAEVLVGIQNLDRADPKTLDQLAKQPKTIILDTSSAQNLSSNLNQLIKKSRGHYFVRTDDDDFMHPLRIRRLTEIVESGKDFAILGQAYKCFSDSKAGILMAPSKSSLENKKRLLLGVPFAHPAITLDIYKCGEAPYDENQMYAQDYMLYVDMLKKGNYLGSSDMATYYHLPPFGIATDQTKRIRQLECHEKAMSKIWNTVSTREYSKNEIHIIRSSLVTSEYSSEDPMKDRQWCISELREAVDKLTEYVGIE